MITPSRDHGFDRANYESGTHEFLTSASTVSYIAMCLVLDGTGAALIWAPSMNAAMESSPEEKRGSVAGVFNMLRFVMGALGTVMVGVVLDLAFREPTMVGPVSGYLHAYLALSTLTALALFRARDLNVRTASSGPAVEQDG